MQILKDGVMPDGTEIRMEEWNESYEFMPYGATIASYPISKSTHKGSFAPKEGEGYRFSFNFETHEEAKCAFDDLVSGNKTLADFKDKFNGKREYLDCF
ncbi:MULTISPECIES: hypothetical protein [Bacillales]|uniref:hypothetical protein n=1 Tax=Bacillales TaxID=1385 RepID=UPI000653A52A|nr:MULTISPECIES: hypothetical protein [Bacillales]KRT89312.1 hypothetical protein ACH97_218885 [Bacillus paralicheniformis]MEC1870707.1 hypothetical protein [Bacillus paralicheniformis]MED0673849.1 hypothetical protein [Aneurinibacillus aneurinilyticus]NCL92451.1 hypothetical protein [Bacillus licheniformis]OJT57347.1 hypothetical protein BFP47_11600 [Bacillus licheniformis]